MMNYKYKLLIGLGNPGPDYALTYHNAGSFFIDLLSSGKKFKKTDGFVYSKIGDVVLIKPLSFMNESGASVKLAIKYFKTTLSETLIIHDDSDLSMGEYKFATNRGSAGHNGIKSIMEVCKTSDINRLRLGIRHNTQEGRLKAGLPRRPLRQIEVRAKAGDFVLTPMGKKDIAALQGIASNLKRELLGS